MGAPWWRKGPLITEDANCVAHVYWRNGALVDSKGNSWTMNGTVPQTGSAGSIPPGAGPFSDANYYSLGSGADVLDFSGDFTSTFVYFTPIGSVDGWMFSNGSALGSPGWAFNWANGSGTTTLYISGTATPDASPSYGDGALCVTVAGRSGTNSGCRTNAGTYRSVVVPTTFDSTSSAKIGRYNTAGIPFGGVMLECYFTTTAISSSLAASIISQTFSRMRRSP